MKEFLQQLLPTLSWVSNAEKQFAIVAGYDEADTMLNNLRNVEFPLVMVEDIPEGYLSFEDTFLDNRTTSFWVMAPVKVADSESREQVLRDCYSKG